MTPNTSFEDALFTGIAKTNLKGYLRRLSNILLTWYFLTREVRQTNGRAVTSVHDHTCTEVLFCPQVSAAKCHSFHVGYTNIFFLWRYSPNLGLDLPPWNSLFHFSFLDLKQSVGLLGRVMSSSQGLYLYINTEKRTYAHTLNIHALSGIRTHDPGFRGSEDSACLRTLGYRDRLYTHYNMKFQTCIHTYRGYAVT
jgi:hypothetical protein